MVKAARLPRRPATSDGSVPSTTSPISSHSFSHLLSRTTSVRHLNQEVVAEENEEKNRMSRDATTPSGLHLPSGSSTTPPIAGPSSRATSTVTATARQAEASYRSRPSLSTSHLNGGNQNGHTSQPLTLTNSNHSFQSFSSLTPGSETGPQIPAAPSSNASLDFQDVEFPPPPKASQAFLKRRGKRHHAYGRAVPYPESYEKRELDHDVLDTNWQFNISHDITHAAFPDGPPKRVLDLGCGTGAWVLRAAEHWKETCFVGFDLVRIQPDLNLLEHDPPDKATESAKTKLLNQLAQPPSATAASTAGLKALGGGTADEEPSGRPVHKSLTVHDKQPKGVAPSSSSEHPLTGRNRSASIPLSMGPLSSAAYRAPHLSASNLLNPLSGDSSTSAPTANCESGILQRPPITTTGPTLESLVAALPENALYGGVSNEAEPLPCTRAVGDLRLKQRIKWVHGNFLEPLPFPDGFFDFVRMRRVARGVPEDMWDMLFTELNRVLRIGGVIEVNEGNMNFPGGAFPSLTVGNGRCSDSTPTSRSRRNMDRPAFVGCLKATRPKGGHDDLDYPTSPGSPPLVPMAAGYIPLRDTGSTFFHNGYGYGYIAPPTITRSPGSTLRSPPRILGRPSSADPGRNSQTDPKAPPTTTGLSVAPTAIFDDPRDHTILESIYLSLHESRFIHLQPLFIIPEYLGSVFGQVKSHPAAIFLAPDREIDGPGVAGGRQDPEGGTPMLNGIVDDLAVRAFAARAMGIYLPVPGTNGEENAQTGHDHSAFTMDLPDGWAAPSLTAVEDCHKRQAAMRRERALGKSSSSSSGRPSTSDPSLPRKQFVEDFMAVDPTRTVKRTLANTLESIKMANTPQRRTFSYDVGHAGLLLSMEVASVLACVEEMWEHAKSMDHEALRPVFDEKVTQYVVDMRNRIQLEATVERRLHWEGRNKGQSELQKDFEARLQQVLTQEEELIADEAAMTSDDDTNANSTITSKTKSSQDTGRRMTSESSLSSMTPTAAATSSRRKLERVVDGEFENYANGRIISRNVRVWCAVKEENFRQLTLDETQPKRV
ncbi:hypothetical protein FRB94_003231 [Tulasnella sp. JGI-2019a]|nr:hypothetical protein FRB94_003231 [Tulasnella sp. JGI-2019a]KAG9003680.1 hypothetical protein FRB93_010901 [Tulasnella sp. JGI-2019a]